MCGLLARLSGPVQHRRTQNCTVEGVQW